MKKLLFRTVLILIGVMVTVGLISTNGLAASAKTRGCISIAIARRSIFPVYKAFSQVAVE